MGNEKNDPNGYRQPNPKLPFYAFLTSYLKRLMMDKITDMVMTLSDKILRLREHESYLKHRSSRHQKTTESTQSRVLVSTIVEGVVLIGLNLWQGYYLKSFFETKRVI